MKRNGIFLTFIWMLVSPFADAQSSTPYAFSKTSIGIAVLSSTSSGGNLHVEYTLRSGSIYEKDSTSGVNAVLLFLVQQELKKQLATESIIVKPILTSEQVGFAIDARTGDFEKILMSLSKSFFSLKIDQPNLELAKQNIESVEQAKYENPVWNRENTIQRKLWNADYKKINPTGSLELLKMLSLKRVEIYYSRYFHPANSTLVVVDNQAKDKLIQKVETVFSQSNSFFNPEQITRLLELKPIVNFTQHVYVAEDGEPNKVGILFQNPGVRYDRRGSYCANILAQIIANNSDGRIQAVYQSYNYFASFDLVKLQTDNKFASGIDELANIIDSLRTLHFVTPAMMAKAKDEIINQYQKVGTQDPTLFLNQTAKYRLIGDENYIRYFADSVQTVTQDEMDMYLNEYFINKAGIRYIVADAKSLHASIESEKVYDLDESVADLKVMFELNKADLNGDSNFLVIDKITQWMIMNSDFFLQINAFADNGEYPKMNDEEVIKFMDSVPSFKKVKPFIIKTKTLRPEMVRGLKVMKLLYDRGIPIERMSGTSMVFSSDSDAESIENKKCTFTFEKRKPAISIYSYRKGSRF